MKRNLLVINVVLLAALLILTQLAQVAYADNISVYADTQFDAITTTLSKDKSVSFFANTYKMKECISVSSCWLELQVNGEWVWQRALETPSIQYNTHVFSAMMDYSAYIGKGTYRVGAVYEADGHSATRYSFATTY